MYNKKERLGLKYPRELGAEEYPPKIGRVPNGRRIGKKNMKKREKERELNSVLRQQQCLERRKGNDHAASRVLWQGCQVALIRRTARPRRPFRFFDRTGSASTLFTILVRVLCRV